jgi:hypothetical protein
VKTWDSVVEELTGMLVRMTSGEKGIEGVVVTAGEAYVAFAGDDETLMMQTPSNDFLPDTEQLDDFQQMLIFGLGYEYDMESEEPENFAKELELDEPGWEEQTLREVALEAVGMLRYVYVRTRPDAYEVERAEEISE